MTLLPRHADVEGLLSLDEVIEALRGGLREQAERASTEQITLFKSVGTALQALAVAGALYRRAKERGLGQDAGEFPKARG